MMHTLEVTLRGVLGPAEGVEASVKQGRSLSTGRSNTAEVALPWDRTLSRMHFEIEVAGEQVFVRDLGSSNGTFVNGSRIAKHPLLTGDMIAAGASVFRVEIATAILPVDLLHMLSSQTDPLFAVLDTARSPDMYPRLVAGGVPYQCLYTGEAAANLEHVAPYLVLLPPNSAFLELVVELGWANAWGIFLTSSASMEEVRHQLRRSLMVRVGKDQTLVYFRFYDPRVLRVFLPSADPGQAAEFAGCISSFLVEDEDPNTLLRFGGPGAGERLAIVRPQAS